MHFSPKIIFFEFFVFRDEMMDREKKGKNIEEIDEDKNLKECKL